MVFLWFFFLSQLIPIRHLWRKQSKFELKWYVVGPLLKLCVTLPFSINFRSKIENQVSDYMLLWGSSLLEVLVQFIENDKKSCNTARIIFSFLLKVLSIIVLTFFFWLLDCLSFDLWLLIPPLVCSNFSWGHGLLEKMNNSN